MRFSLRSALLACILQPVLWGCTTAKQNVVVDEPIRNLLVSVGTSPPRPWRGHETFVFGSIGDGLHIRAIADQRTRPAIIWVALSTPVMGKFEYGDGSGRFFTAIVDSDTKHYRCVMLPSVSCEIDDGPSTKISIRFEREPIVTAP
jgi:hypothetical protein